MTKKQIHSEINKAFYNFVAEKYPQYEIVGDYEGGRKQIVSINTAHLDLEYHVSQHSVCAYNNKYTREIEEEMNLFLQEQLRKYNI